MEPILAVIILFAGYIASYKQQPSVNPTVAESNSCIEICNSGTVQQYKHCKCLIKPQWERDNKL